MKLVYALEPIPYGDPMIFLAGPTPRSNAVRSWRPDMMASLERLLTQLPESAILIPEDRSGEFHGNYNHQTEWEHLAISSCDVLLFWVPRDIDGGLPGFTTNVELGYWLRDKFVVLGYPRDAEKMSYPSWLYTKTTRRHPHHSMDKTAFEAAGEVTAKYVTR